MLNNTAFPTLIEGHPMNSYFPHLTALCLTTALVTGCATEHSPPLKPQAPGGRKHLPRPKPLISVGKFDNRSSFYERHIFRRRRPLRQPS